MYARCLVISQIRAKKPTTAKKCENCCFTTFSKLHFLRHCCEVKDKGFQCEECYLIRKTRISLEKHKEKAHEFLTQLEWFTCEFCYYKTILKENLEIHRQSKHSKNSRQDGAVVVHVALAEQNWLKCEVCEYKTIIKANFDAHMQMKHSKKAKRTQEKVECEFCKLLISKHSIKRHIQTAHLEKKQKKKRIKINKEVTCELCQKSFIGSTNLDYHLKRAHNIGKVEPSQCSFCDYKTLYKGYLKAHMFRRHNEGREGIKCDFCDHTAFTQSSLKEHIYRSHTKDEDMKWFQCASCDFKSKWKRGLKTHLQTCKAKKLSGEGPTNLQ